MIMLIYFKTDFFYFKLLYHTLSVIKPHQRYDNFSEEVFKVSADEITQ